jgi:hypothetical protein
LPNILGLTNDGVPSFGITKIPVFVDGQFVYSSAMQRVLQLAANIYDATTNSFYPSVFRPYFSRDLFGNLFVTGFTNVVFVSGAGDVALSTPFDVNIVAQPSGSNVLVNVYGVPWIIGAKRGLPNFNEFSMEEVVQVTRNLQLARTTNGVASLPGAGGIPARLTATNQMYIFSISNSIGIECWNSYSNSYPNPVQVVAQDNMWMLLTNDSGAPYLALSGYPAPYSINTNFTVTAWSGTTNPSSFIIPLNTAVALLTNDVYYFGSSPPGYLGFEPLGLGWETNTVMPVALPHFGLLTTNRLQVFMLDNGHVIDYVQFSGPDSSRNLNTELADPDSSGLPAFVWSTNFSGSSFVPYGIINQISVSSGSSILPTPQDGGRWVNPPGLPSNLILIGKNGADQAYFSGFLAPNSIYSYRGITYTNLDILEQTPFTPTRTAVYYTTWQANDPLVHYLQSDLHYSGYDPSSSTSMRTGITISNWSNLSPPSLINIDLGKINVRYQPWGIIPPPENLPDGSRISAVNYDMNPYNLAFKDPLVNRSDNWDFPANKFPTVGWLGRVHRGTPWQTIYLKGLNILGETNTIQHIGTGINTWSVWTGNTADEVHTAPLQDRLLFDVFSTAPNDNATRGQLSVNVGAPNGSSFAAWSALFSGMIAITNTTSFPPSFPLTNKALVIQPAGTAWTNSALGQLVVGINTARATFTNADGLVGAFEHVGDILSTPELTEQSPFLNTSAAQQQPQFGISDELYEWLPQQTMSLLRASSAPRYVIYSYGQTLKPAANGIVTSGPFFGMVANYQIVAEIATRAFVRVEGVTGADGTPLPPSQAHPHIVIESYNILPPD